MKYILLLFLAVISTQNTIAQRKVKGNGNVIEKARRVPVYDKVAINSDFEVALLTNDYNKTISVSGDANLHQLIETKVVDGTLIINKKPGFEILSSNAPLKVSITSKTIKEISVEGSGKFYNLGAIEILNFKFINKGSAEVVLRLKTDELNIDQQGSGNIVLSGNSNTVKINQNSSGNIDAKDLSAFYTEVEAKGSGNIYSNTINGIDGSINGSGNLYLKHTKTINVKQNGSGQILKY